MRIDVVVNRINPFDVGTKARLAAQVDSQMDTQTRFVRHRINQAAKRRASRNAEVVATRQIKRRHMPRIESANLAGQCIGLQTRALLITHAALIVVGAAPAYLHDEAPVARLDRLDRCMKRAHGAIAFGIALNRQHQLMTIDIARARREHCLDTFERRFQRLRLGARQSASGRARRFPCRAP